MREAPEKAVGLDRRAGKRGLLREAPEKAVGLDRRAGKRGLTLMKLPLRQGSRRNQVARLGGANSALSGGGPVRGCPVAEGRKGDGV